MATNDEKLERFTSAILNDATQVCDAVRQEIDREYKRALSAAENELLSEANNYIKSEISKIKTAEGKRLSKKLLEAKRALARRRSEITESVFKELSDRILSYAKTPEYESLLLSLSGKAAVMLGSCSDITVYLRNADMPSAGKIKAAFKPNDVLIKEGSFALGGIVVESKEKRMRIDESFDLSLSERHEHFIEMFGVSLAEL